MANQRRNIASEILRLPVKPVRKIIRRRDKRRRHESGVDCVSFPKSGRTWLRYMLDQMGQPIRFSHAGPVRDRPPVGSYDAAAHYNPQRRVIFLHRDPRDTAVSFYFETTKRIHVFEGDISQFLRDMRYGLPAILEFNEAWLDLLADKPDVLIATYEDMRAAPHTELRRLAGFIAPDAPPSDEAIAAAVDGASMSNMRRTEGGFRAWLLYGKAMLPRDESDRDSFKVRRGKVGGFSDYFSAEDHRYANALLAGSRHYAHLPAGAPET